MSGADTTSDRVRRMRDAEEERYRAAHPNEGLRERKRRLTRRAIADTATAMFFREGFDAVKVSEIADRANVSLKTLYNYFPTKESMVLDAADEVSDGIVAALAARTARQPITDAFADALESIRGTYDLLDPETAAYVATTFATLIDETPSLRAHWLETQDRLAGRVAAELAAEDGGDPGAPETMIASRALVGLVTVEMDSRVRHLREGRRGAELRQAVASDVRRAAEQLERGLGSLTARTAQDHRRTIR